MAGRVAQVHQAAFRQNDDALAVGELDLELDLDAHRVWRGGREVELSPTELSLLRCLMANAGRVVSRAQILDAVWHYDFQGESTIIESFVSNLRRKVDDVEPRLIRTVRGVGYSIREP